MTTCLMTRPCWHPPKGEPPEELRRADVHVWSIDLTLPNRQSQTMLTDEDWRRAERYVFADDRNRYLRSRTALRSILSCYTGQHPRDLLFGAGTWGKPFIRGARELHFNLSHSGDAALCAVSRREVGIDVQRIRRPDHLLEMADRYFSPAESAALRRMDDARLVAAFFRCWTRKEAYVKACGRGLSVPLASFTVSLDISRPRLLHSQHGDAGRWHMTNVPVPEGYESALAADGDAGRPERFFYYQFITHERKD